MIDVTARDGPGRLATWETDQGTVGLPTVAHVHTDRHPAPAFARLALSRDQHPDLATIQVQGTVFTTGTPEHDEALPRGLIYPGAAGSSLQEAADDLNVPSGRFQMANRPEALGDHPGLAVMVGARSVARDPWRLPATLIQARGNAGPNAVLFLPGIGRPDEIAIAAWCGVDIFDGLIPVLEGFKGTYLTAEGAMPVDEVTETTCPCQACATAEDQGWDRSVLVAHNRWVAEAEARRARQAIASGSLRELAEKRAHTAPELLAVLRRLDREHLAFFEARSPVLRKRKLPVLSRESLGRPAIQRWVGRLEERYTPPGHAQTLVVLPCSATKPYEESPTHRRIRPVINKNGRGRAHVVTLTSPIGAVPEELEFAYPAARYDIPVTGTWFDEEADIVARAFGALADTGGYENVILHVPPEEAELVADVFDDPVVTLPEGARATDTKVLGDLGSAVSRATAGLDAVARDELFRQHMVRRGDWQFGPGVGQALMEDVEIKGRYPFLRLITGGDEQVAMLRPQRGTLVLTEEGGRRVGEATDAYDVEIDDFHPKGTIFAPGVISASEAIRVGDEVVVAHDGEYRGTGRAVAPGCEMGPMVHGPCVEVRHHA